MAGDEAPPWTQHVRERAGELIDEALYGPGGSCTGVRGYITAHASPPAFHIRWPGTGTSSLLCVEHGQALVQRNGGLPAEHFHPIGDGDPCGRPIARWRADGERSWCERAPATCQHCLADPAHTPLGADRSKRCPVCGTHYTGPRRAAEYAALVAAGLVARGA